MVTPRDDEIGPVHQRSGPDTLWTTVNAAEQIPGVLTPLAFTFWIGCADLGVRATFCSLGVLPPREVRLGDTPDERICGAFYGRWVANLDQFRRLADMTPGVSGATFEKDVFGSDRPDRRARVRLARLPIIALKAPVTVGRLPGTVHRAGRDVRTWWRESTSPRGQAGDAVEQLLEAVERSRRAAALQMLAATVGQGMFARLGQLCQRAGRSDLYLTLCSGYGESEETRMIGALYDLVHGRSTLEQFLDEHGARCPAEVDLAARSYRENPDAVHALVRKYRLANRQASLAEESDRRVQRRIAAERDLLAALPLLRRPAARLLMRLARTYIPLREEGKAVMVTAVDGARSAARARGRELTASGAIADPPDVFYLTLEEILGDPPPEAAELVAHRRALGQVYQGITLPTRWTGMPAPIQAERGAPTGPEILEVNGIGAAPGTAEGRARVILDADQCDTLEPDEILVCRTTDPSWASAFHLASAVVIDIGGLSSHGAIVCREFGLPCVINTEVGTRHIRTGDLVRVNGATGNVILLERA
ncbi:MAG TPA: PEP-utilizing enzyme [Pseudonocardia sp.]